MLIGTLPDVNVWLALLAPLHPYHDAAKEWFQSHNERDSVLFCRATQLSFLRLITTRVVLSEYSLQTFTNVEALDLLAAYLEIPVVGVAAEPPGLEEVFKDYAGLSSASPNVWMDAYLAAFAKAGHHMMVATDKGFRRFSGLNLVLLSPQ